MKGRSLFKFFKQAVVRVGADDFAPRFLGKRNSALGRERETNDCLRVKKWHVAKRLLGQIGQVD